MPRKTTKVPPDATAVAPEKDSAKSAKKTTTARKTAQTQTPARVVKPPLRPRKTAARTVKAAPVETPPAPEVVNAPAAKPAANYWRRMDLHTHTPASRDYEQPETMYIDILRQAERRGLEIIAFTDHNTANGYRNLQREIADLELLERLGRIQAAELGRLNEYRRLMKKILVLPGFEFTATFGFHILGIFPPEMPLRDLDFILMQLRVPSKVVEQGLTEAGATSDVLTAYRTISEGGGIAIAPHANSSNGVFMRGMNIGGQTRIAYTQDAHLSAIELTDLVKGRRSMASWFNGYKPEYSRRMHIIQSSDAHRLTASLTDPKRLGLGERASEVYLPELSFNALKELFQSQEFDRIRHPDTAVEIPNDQLREAREKGNNATQSFHPSLLKRGDKYTPIVTDVAGLANANGGTIYIGCEGNIDKQAAGVTNTDELSAGLADAIKQRITPPLPITIDLQRTDDVDILRATVPSGEKAPYAIDGASIFVRGETDTHTATRDELFALVKRTIELESETAQANTRATQDSKPAQHGQRHQQPSQQHNRQPQSAPASQGQNQRPAQQGQPQPAGQRGPSHRDQRPRQQGQGKPPVNGNRTAPVSQTEEPVTQIEITPVEIMQVESTPRAPQPPIEPQAEGSPRSGVEILSFEERDGARYYTVRDLRNKSIVRNVTRKSARDLWLYALQQHAGEVYDISTFNWDNERTILSRSQRAGKVRYDIALRDPNSKVHIFYGVSDDGMDNRWRDLIQATMPSVAEEMPATQDEAAADAQSASAPQPDVETSAASQPVAESDNLPDNTPLPDTQS